MQTGWGALQVMSNGVMDGLLRRWQSDINQCTGVSLVRTPPTPSLPTRRGACALSAYHVHMCSLLLTLRTRDACRLIIWAASCHRGA